MSFCFIRPHLCIILAATSLSPYPNFVWIWWTCLQISSWCAEGYQGYRKMAFADVIICCLDSIRQVRFFVIVISEIEFPIISGRTNIIGGAKRCSLLSSSAPSPLIDRRWVRYGIILRFTNNQSRHSFLKPETHDL